MIKILLIALKLKKKLIVKIKKNKTKIKNLKEKVKKNPCLNYKNKIKEGEYNSLEP